MKVNKFFQIIVAFALTSTLTSAATENPMNNAVINVTIVAALAAFVFVIASITTHISTISKVLLKKTQENKKTMITIGLVALAASVNAEPVKGPLRFLFESNFDNMTLYILISVFAILLFVILLLSRSMMTMLQIMYDFKVVKKEVVVHKESYWERWLTKWNSAVPVEREKDVMLDHDYDGIKELDNSLPPWWKYGFYFTIAFAFVYVYYYHAGGNGLLSHEEYAVEMKTANDAKAIAEINSTEKVDEENLAMLKSPEELAEGKSIYSTNCATCHGAQGEGLAGPNLTDNYWLHGGGLVKVFQTIKNGVPGKAMIKWDGILKPKQIHEVASFVWLMQQKPVAGKAPEGEPYAEPSTAAGNSKQENATPNIKSKQ